jgi:branched-chain amino acid transport system permease protein
MRFIFKTDYGQDIRLAKHGGHVFWYSGLLVAMLFAPWVVSEYWLAQLTFILIYGIVGLGLMLLAGFTGSCRSATPPSWASGAYTQAVLTNAGVPFPLALSPRPRCRGGRRRRGLPALRVKGIYLGIATLSFGFIRRGGLRALGQRDGGNAASR